MNLIIVCVDYWDFLERTLPWNARHFTNILVVTSPEDKKTRRLAKGIKKVDLHVTNAFYRDGAWFNKGLAVEEGLDVLGREGWICHLDADTLIPKDVDLQEGIAPGFLYLTQRRFCKDPAAWQGETDWQQWPVSTEMLYVSGFFQLFHAQDSVLAQRPWYPVGSQHAGLSDTDFNDKWSSANRCYFPWHVLHLGLPRENWWGRTTSFPDGTLPAGAKWRRLRMAKMDADRTYCGFAKEKL